MVQPATAPAMATPLVSVVVPTFDCAGTLPATLASLSAQVERDFEVVVSDGGSRDGTVEAARAAASGLPALTVLSRPDRGVYDAINQGIAVARGTWVLVLGGDDRLHASDTLRRATACLRASAADIVYGDVRVMSANRMGVPPGGRYAGPMPLARLLRGNICQQAIFYRRELFTRLGPFDIGYPVLADWEFNLRVGLRGKLEWIDLVVADYAGDGISAQRTDPAATLGVPEMVRQELASRGADRSLWPHQRILLRQADVLRRHGHWRAAGRQIATYLHLRWQRLML